MNLSSLLASVEQIAIDAARLMVEKKPTRAMVSKKGRIDLVTDVDIAVNNLVCRELAKLDRNIDLIAEEGVPSDLRNPKAQYAWVLDPIDGTTNFVHGIDHSAISIALYDRETESSVLGLVHNPFRNECFTALKGEGAFLNRMLITVSEVSELVDAVISTGFAYDRKTNLDNSMAEFMALMPEVQGIRRFGAASLDLAYVAMGRLDGYFERGLRFWDYAAGILLIHEAGGKTCVYDGTQVLPHSNHILASNLHLHGPLLREIQHARTAAGFSLLPAQT